MDALRASCLAAWQHHGPLCSVQQSEQGHGPPAWLPFSRTQHSKGALLTYHHSLSLQLACPGGYRFASSDTCMGFDCILTLRLQPSDLMLWDIILSQHCLQLHQQFCPLTLDGLCPSHWHFLTALPGARRVNTPHPHQSPYQQVSNVVEASGQFHEADFISKTILHASKLRYRDVV